MDLVTGCIIMITGICVGGLVGSIATADAYAKILRDLGYEIRGGRVVRASSSEPRP